MRVLVTGGAGFIGSHTAAALVEKGFAPIVADNFSTSSTEIPERIAAASGGEVKSVQVDFRYQQDVERMLEEERPEAVIHFAGRKSVEESLEQPLAYYEHNMAASIHLIRAMKKTGVNRLIFSSSATIYGTEAPVPAAETAPAVPFNPYGRSKLMVEQVLQDEAAADPDWRIAVLRYFNPVGAHPSRLIGENPRTKPGNLAPVLMQVLRGDLPYLRIFGNDYDTHDGTAVRDYVHVCDVAEGHTAALQYLEDHPGCHLFNIGTGTGASVLDMKTMMEKVSGRTIPFRFEPRRRGDAAVSVADVSRAEQHMNWRAARSLEDMCRDLWQWKKSIGEV
ncbi:UDP-glucose 4-epimerase GalE [Alkalicoccus chagannorensis]|uniref:UDP-glucose 4-epimerase GalE n=1 Tax=Alkalicoccus chagannorensis TaxID=427072 RepID=UPI0004257DC2|nr:UDP-glucose 4-epimerase GalE [Alkalicoccus chagannorensis]